MTGVPSLAKFIGFLFLPETPRWLMKNGNEQEATRVLQRINGQQDVANDMQIIRDMCMQEIKQEHNDQGL